MLFEEISYLYDQEPHDAALNMGIDEELLRSAGKPLLRIYFWKEPAVSFGYFGKFREIEEHWPGREQVRRWTGGGTVPHGEDLTYTLIVPRDHPFSALRATESYALIHTLLADVVRGSSAYQIDLAPAAAAKVSAACFENPAQHDVMLGTEKIAGAAQRRTQWGLLHQGSLQMANLPSGFADQLASSFAPRINRNSLDRALLNRAEVCADKKYRTDAWTRRF